MYANHLPMTGGGVLSGRSEGAAAEGGPRLGIGWKSSQGFDVPQAEAAQIGKPHRPPSRDVAQCVAAGVSVGGGVGHLADSHAVEHDPDDTPEHFSTVARLYRPFGG